MTQEKNNQVMKSEFAGSAASVLEIFTDIMMESESSPIAVTLDETSRVYLEGHLKGGVGVYSEGRLKGVGWSIRIEVRQTGHSFNVDIHVIGDYNGYRTDILNRLANTAIFRDYAEHARLMISTLNGLNHNSVLQEGVFTPEEAFRY